MVLKHLQTFASPICRQRCVPIQNSIVPHHDKSVEFHSSIVPNCIVVLHWCVWWWSLIVLVHCHFFRCALCCIVVFDPDIWLYCCIATSFVVVFYYCVALSCLMGISLVVSQKFRCPKSICFSGVGKQQIVFCLKLLQIQIFFWREWSRKVFGLSLVCVSFEAVFKTWFFFNLM